MTKKLLKMKDLSRATGVSGGTIRYYVRKGILPQPVKVHRNMAYYDESYIERIRLIKQLQKKRYLPLNIIKMILEESDVSSWDGEQRQLLKDIDKPLFKDSLLKDQIAPMDREELAAHTDTETEDIEALESIGVISSDPEGRFDRECIRIAELSAELRDVGLTKELDFQVEHLQIHQDLIEFLARKEIDLFTKRIANKGMSSQEISELIDRAVEIINKIIPIIHFRMIRKISEEIE